MKIKKIDENFSTATQITVADIPVIKAAGIASIICNRPNDEGSNQPSFEEVAAAAKSEGISTMYIPLNKDQEPTIEVQAFADALAELPCPTLGYCRSGLRSAKLWSLASLGSKTKDEIIKSTKSAGYDMYLYLYYGNKPTLA